MQKLNEPLDKKQIFLLLFSRELIRNSVEGLSLLKEIIEQQNKPTGEEIPVKKEQEFPLIKSILSEEPQQKEQVSVLKPVNIHPQRMDISDGFQRNEYPILRIPEPKLPAEFQYLKPVPSTKEIDLDKLNSLVNDPKIREIECEAPDKPVVVYGNMGRMPTGVTLSNNEIEDIIQRFSKASKIPVDVGIYKVVVGNLIFSAIISDVIPSRFLITKMKPSTQTIIQGLNRPQQRPFVPKQSMEYSAYIRK